MKSSVLIVGSSNTDMVIMTDHLPAPGETIIGGRFFMNPGGKGANQAVAAARLDGNITFITKTGDDLFGRQAKELFKNESINTSYIFIDKLNPSGVALICVDSDGENCISVASGANGTLNVQNIQEASQAISDASFVLMQLEIPLETVAFVAATASQQKIPVILNPAPACALPNDLLKNITIITPNETEAELLTGIKVDSVDAAKTAALALNAKGIETVIITLGAKGALLLHQGIFNLVASMPVKAVDTTAAGDVFNGAFVVALSEGKSMPDAVTFGCKAAAISVTRLGAQSSAPKRSEVIDS
jgi:ribokinase